jgi:hypothetical protein
MAKISNIPDSDNVLRFAKKKHLIWELDAEGKPVEIKGCYHDLFKLRNDEEFIKKHGGPEKSLSVNWLEFFKGDDAYNFKQAVADFLGSSRELKKTEAFAKLNVGEIKSICTSHSAKVRIIHDADNSTIKSHGSVNQLPQDNSFLFDDLCELAMKAIFPAKKIIG